MAATASRPRSPSPTARRRGRSAPTRGGRPRPDRSGHPPGSILAPLTGTSFVVTIASTRDVMTVDRHLQQPVVMPVGLAELGVSAPPVRAGPAGLLDTGCRSDLLTLDGQPLPVQITGSWSEAVEGAALPLRPCGDPDSLALGAGEHIVRSAPGTTTGLDVDRVVLASAAGGEPAATGPLLADRTAPTPTATVTETGRTSRKVEVDGGDGPFWLVLGEGLNRGWKATAKRTGPWVTPVGGRRHERVEGGPDGWRGGLRDAHLGAATVRVGRTRGIPRWGGGVRRARTWRVGDRRPFPRWRSRSLRHRVDGETSPATQPCRGHRWRWSQGSWPCSRHCCSTPSRPSSSPVPWYWPAVSPGSGG